LSWVLKTFTSRRLILPKRNDIKKILIIGSGPIIIGQACEFDYSGTQALKTLKEEGFDVILFNSNPATIMTDPDFARATYIEPLVPESAERIIEKERPDAILPTLGGQTALNLSMNLAKRGILEKYGVKLIGAGVEAIDKAENRELFKKCIENIGLSCPKSMYIRQMSEAKEALELVGLPAIIRPSFTLGGTGGNIAYNKKEYERYVDWALNLSPVSEVLVEESVLGWKEYELEVMRDSKDNVVIICTIENFDPMGVHTGDSITVAPAQTLTDKEFQLLRDYSIKIIREIGVETGGSNIQFGVNPIDGRIVVIEMNPRVSRSSALASKATGYPIAKIAAKLAVGYTLDEIPNDITKKTMASFEPVIDYVVTKIPRFDFNKFPQAQSTLTTQMKSVGEVMAIGRTFKESLQKAIRSLEIGSFGFERSWEGSRGHSGKGPKKGSRLNLSKDAIASHLRTPNPERLWYIAEAYRKDFSTDEIFRLTSIDRWFLHNIKEIVDFEKELLRAKGNEVLELALIRKAKSLGFSDKRIGELIASSEAGIRDLRNKNGILPVYKRVDTCSAEFKSYTPYLYSTYEREDESETSSRKKVVILGSGPNRIGQGIEFDYCCVHASFALRDAGIESIMVNCNPETVSTDFDISDRLYFEPLTAEDVLNILEKEKPYGVILQFGGQTPLKLAREIEKAGFNVLGTSVRGIDIAEDREKFSALLTKMNVKQHQSAIARSADEVETICADMRFPLMVRPSYVLGGRAMEVVFNMDELRDYLARAVSASPEHPVLIDIFLENSIEVDVDAVCDGKDVFIGGVMEHIEQAGVHSGDSSCVLPPFSISSEIVERMEEFTREIAKSLEVIGLLNIQFAIKGGEVYVLEVNPRASRTVPFVSKATGNPLAKIAVNLMLGQKLESMNLKSYKTAYFSVKSPVFPFLKFPNVDTLLGPEMKSTGEVMGIDDKLEIAYAKAQAGAGNILPHSGILFLSVKDPDKERALEVANIMTRNGFKIFSTHGTAIYLRSYGLAVEEVRKVKEGRPDIVDLMTDGKIGLVFNTTAGRVSLSDSFAIRRTALEKGIPYFTTIEGAKAAAKAITEYKRGKIETRSIQSYYGHV
jgi:carbamoyl-phosphate synthase large subunit